MVEARSKSTISQAAAILGVSAQWLRFGERLGSLPLARRTSGGHRFYLAQDIERLRRLGVGAGKRRSAGSDG